jgi:hypothetical protein
VCRHHCQGYGTLGEPPLAGSRGRAWAGGRSPPVPPTAIMAGATRSTTGAVTGVRSHDTLRLWARGGPSTDPSQEAQALQRHPALAPVSSIEGPLTTQVTLQGTVHIAQQGHEAAEQPNGHLQEVQGGRERGAREACKQDVKANRCRARRCQDLHRRPAKVLEITTPHLAPR